MKKCLACGVVIDNDMAIFSVGKPGSLDYLAQRVCQYRKVDSPCSNPVYDSNLEYPPGYEDLH